LYEANEEFLKRSSNTTPISSSISTPFIDYIFFIPRNNTCIFCLLLKELLFRQVLYMDMCLKRGISAQKMTRQNEC
jgi:hypothetical protein